MDTFQARMTQLAFADRCLRQMITPFWGTRQASHPRPGALHRRSGHEHQLTIQSTLEVSSAVAFEPPKDISYCMPKYLDQTPYHDLRALMAERSGRLVAWAGAGLSVPAGVPSWAGLRHHLSEELQRKGQSLDRQGQELASRQLHSARTAESPWDAFAALRLGLGETSYQATIRKSLKVAHTAQPPPAYELIWRLPISGFINLNLDRLATRAFASVYGGAKAYSEFSSRDVGAHTHILANPHTQFIYNAHGIDDDVTSWVFTRRELNTLFSEHTYQNFIHSILSTTTVVFVGISADDRAAGGHLERLKQAGIDTAIHYWITDRTDKATDQWAEQRNIQVIRYGNSDGTHGELSELLNDLRTYVATQEPVPAVPVYPKAKFTVSGLPSPQELVKEEAEMIRLFLNSHAQSLLSSEDENDSLQYAEFQQEYDRAIWNAWYVSLTPPENVILGYELLKDEARGAFGKVYKALRSDGKIVAVKVLLQEIRNDPNALACFRRGVGSMRILKAHGVKGMVEYLEAAEIPALVVMEWVEGENLRSAVVSRSIDSWSDVLKVGVELSGILREAHSLPERVLHRDLRPANIMLEGLHRNETWCVKVLDFDLSWHRGAQDRTMVHESGTTGYLAPEQIQRVQGVSTRHSAVDSFGLGMTLYFMMSGHDPLPDQHRHSDWSSRVHQATKNLSGSWWMSVRARATRLIIGATRDAQSERPDMTSMNLELSRLKKLVDDPELWVDLDILAEEIACRSSFFDGYIWNEDQQAAVASRPTGLSLELKANQMRNRVSLRLFWIEQGYENKKSITKKLSQALADARRILNDGGWKVELSASEKMSSFTLVAHWRTPGVGNAIVLAAELVDRIAHLLSTD